MTRPVLVFDVNETLLDITPLEPLFADWFDDPGAMRSWFAQIVLYSQSLTLAGRYLPFGSVAGDILDMMAQIEGRALPEGASSALKAAMAHLPAHSDVGEGLTRLQEQGFRLVTLTNGDAETQAKQLFNAGIAGCFQAQFSVDAVKQFKPAPATYRHVAAEMQVDISRLAMIACHPWDLLGAAGVGMRPVFIKRSGNSQPRFTSAETLEIDDVGELAALDW